jgi:hypothetical protein
MRQTIKGLVAAFAVMTAGAAPAMACGYNPCGTSYEQAYTYAPAYTYTPSYTYAQPYTGCGSCGTASVGWGYERLAEPTTQYYYANQGPTYTGPGAFAPEPAYQEDAVPSYGYGYRPHYRHYGYNEGYAPRHYGYGYHSGYAPHRYGYRYGGYTPHRYSSYRYGHEGSYWGHPLVRRYY